MFRGTIGLRGRLIGKAEMSAKFLVLGTSHMMS
jgi:hypothetical protein